MTKEVAISHNSMLLSEIQQIIDHSRQYVARVVNSEITVLYWAVGMRIHRELLKGERAEYGKQIFEKLSLHLTQTYGKGWSARHLRDCLRMAEVVADEQILHTLCAKLSWSHLRLIMAIDEPIKRDFYIEICCLENWSVRQLQERIKSMLFERTAISKKPEKTIQQEIANLRNEKILSPDLTFRDPYILNFLGLSDSYDEYDLESAIVSELQRFIIELGGDFAFLARQKRITIDNRDYKIDLLFYHRRMKCLVAIDLKIGEFEAAYKGQMELYLRYLEKYEQLDGENTPVGLILCTGKNHEHVELLQLDKSNIRVAEYLTLLPSRKILEEKLHQSIQAAHQRLAMKNEIF